MLVTPSTKVVSLEHRKHLFRAILGTAAGFNRTDQLFEAKFLLRVAIELSLAAEFRRCLNPKVSILQTLIRHKLCPASRLTEVQGLLTRIDEVDSGRFDELVSVVREYCHERLEACHAKGGAA